MKYLMLVGVLLAAGCGLTGGRACAISEGHILYSGAPVIGDYPDVQFTVGASNTEPCCPTQAGVRFTGKRDSRRTSSATSGPSIFDSSVRQRRSATDAIKIAP